LQLAAEIPGSEIIMLMTHAPETGARNRRQFSAAGFWRRFLERVSSALVLLFGEVFSFFLFPS